MAESKFGFVPEEDDRTPGNEPDLALQFAPTPVERPLYALQELDKAAEAAGFASREPSVPRRRRTQREPASRALAIRMTESQFTRFLRYADRQQLTYNETLSQLLDLAGEPE